MGVIALIDCIGHHVQLVGALAPFAHQRRVRAYNLQSSGEGLREAAQGYTISWARRFARIA